MGSLTIDWFRRHDGRPRRWNLPPSAVREAVINAVAHADYAQRGAPIRVSACRHGVLRLALFAAAGFAAGVHPGIVRRMNASNMGTVKAVSPCAGL